MISGAILLFGQLFYTQILNVKVRQQAQNRSLSTKIITPPRGVITDRHGELIVVNDPSYDLSVVIRELDPKMDTLAFCSLLNITKDDFVFLFEKIRSLPYYRRSLPMNFLSNISSQEYAPFQEQLYRFPGFYASLKNQRNYPYPHGAHILGYVSEVSPEDISNSPDLYSMGDLKGSNGIERVYDDHLRGKKGIQYVLKDNMGREVDNYAEGALDSAALSGAIITSSLDIMLQQLGEELLNNKRGSIVAIEPSTGEILCMVTSPSYDPNSLIPGRSRNETYRRLLYDTINRPLLDRSIQAQYPPGSIIKPFMALMALQENVINNHKTVSCSGRYFVNARLSQGCRNHPSPVNLVSALQFSCNSYFFQSFRDFVDKFGYTTPQIGVDKFHDYMRRFGLGAPLEVDLVSELGGFVPDGKYYNKLYNTNSSSWRSTAILSVGIGQGELQLTTIQIANLASIIANRGFFYTPHIVKGIGSDFKKLERFTIRREVGVDIQHFEPVIEGMSKVINEGTGRRAAIKGHEVCGKTGTSQNPHGIDHSVFFGFAPRNNPRIAIAVFIENAGGGGATAAPIGGLMMEQYLNDTISTPRLHLKQTLSELNLINKV